MRRLIVGFFALIGVLALLSVIGLVILVAGLRPKVAPLAGTIILDLDLGKGLADGPGEPEWRRVLFGGQPTLRDALDALERAGDDSRVKGLYAKLGDDNLGLATVEELRDAIAAFRAKGKFAIAFADTFGELGPGTRPYFLAAAFERIWLQPMGGVGLTGLYAEVPFLRGTLDLVGVTPSFEHREQYKTAMNSLTETRMTPPHREEVEGLVQSMAGQVMRGIAKDRKLPEAAVKTAVDRGPLLGEEAVAAKLIDQLGYRDQAIAEAKQRAGAGAKLVALQTYLDHAGRPNNSGAEIALIYGGGVIQRGSESNPLLGGSEGLDAGKVAAAFRKAVDDKEVRAILFRVNSPGGSVVASETVWREVARAGERQKPVIVSMGEVAGSGGYYIAAPAVKIVAEPATLTGSIGVLAGKLVLAGLLKKVGVTTDSAQYGKNAGMFDAAADFSPEAHQRLETTLDSIYKGFKQHVAAGRHMSEEQVEAVAKGRVWTGEDAKQKGLVDALGGYRVALRLAKEAAHIAAAEPVRLSVFPAEKSPGEVIYDRLLHRDKGEDESAGAAALLPPLGPVMPLIGEIAGLFRDPLVLQMPPIGTVR